MRSLQVGMLAAALVLLSGCGGEIQIAKGAVRQAGSAVGNDSITVIKLSSDDIGRLADQAQVSDDVIRDVAPQLDNQSLWSRSIDGVTTVYDENFSPSIPLFDSTTVRI